MSPAWHGLSRPRGHRRVWGLEGVRVSSRPPAAWGLANGTRQTRVPLFTRGAPSPPTCPSPVRVPREFKGTHPSAQTHWRATCRPPCPHPRPSCSRPLPTQSDGLVLDSGTEAKPQRDGRLRPTSSCDEQRVPSQALGYSFSPQRLCPSSLRPRFPHLSSGTGSPWRWPRRSLGDSAVTPRRTCCNQKEPGEDRGAPAVTVRGHLRSGQVGLAGSLPVGPGLGGSLRAVPGGAWERAGTVSSGTRRHGWRSSRGGPGWAWQSREAPTGTRPARSPPPKEARSRLAGLPAREKPRRAAWRGQRSRWAAVPGRVEEGH